MNNKYWDNRYLNSQIGWDIGHASSPLIHLIDEIKDKDLFILIPGCGNAYEAEYLIAKGFRNVCVLDYSIEAINLFRERNPTFPNENIYNEDFFKHHGRYDVILEQTFFCALDVELRDDYIKKMAELLKPGGVLKGVLFNREFQSGPPFGGSVTEYKKRFEKEFQSVSFKKCSISIPQRMGSEVLFKVS